MIARDGKLVYARAAGPADREAKQPVHENTLFRLASMTKPIVVITARALIDQGKLALTDPVTRWLPDFKPKLADGRAPTITVRHLMTHTSGDQDWHVSGTIVQDPDVDERPVVWASL